MAESATRLGLETPLDGDGGSQDHESDGEAAHDGPLIGFGGVPGIDGFPPPLANEPPTYKSVNTDEHLNPDERSTGDGKFVNIEPDQSRPIDTQLHDDLSSLGKADPQPADSQLANLLPVLKNHIYLLYQTNTVLPWDVCRTWTGMEKAIRVILTDHVQDLKYFDEGNFSLHSLMNPVQTRILKEFWDLTIGPGWSVRISFPPPQIDISEPPDDSPQDGFPSRAMESDQLKKKVYNDHITYTIQYYQKNSHSPHSEAVFLSERSYDKPVQFVADDDTSKTVSVLEEIRRVTVPSLPPRDPYAMDPLGYSYGASSSLPLSSTTLKPNDSRPKLVAGARIGQPSLKIHSPYILNTLHAVVTHSWDELSGNKDSLKDGTFDFPFQDLVNHREELLGYKNNLDGLRSRHSEEYNKMCDQHIDQLLGYLYNNPMLPLGSFESDWSESIPMTSFSGAGFLLKPGSDVYVWENDSYNAYVIDSVVGGPDFTTDDSYTTRYLVSVWKLVFNGKSIIRARKEVKVPVFDNKRRITTLPIFPVRFQDSIDNGKQRQRLIERGRKYFRLCKKPAFQEYTGSGLKAGWKSYTNARVVVEHTSRPWTTKTGEFEHEDWFTEEQHDPYLVQAMDPYMGMPYRTASRKVGQTARIAGCLCHDCSNVSATFNRAHTHPTYSDYDHIDPFAADGKELTEHQYLLCASHMFGFILKDRAYDLLDVYGLVEPLIAERAIDRLVMASESKDTIKAIVKTYTDREDHRFRADFIHGKGEGQIILLHGPPGTGKTLTAESVAEFTRRPLLSITAADLGHEPQTLETNLLRFFKNASDWDAIVLLDEADVYLERRNAKDLKRNSIVAIFLRALEYFQGIMFLTTNRVAQFDEAFMSRIHISVGYDPLNDSAREDIWDGLFNKLKEDYERNQGLEIIYDWAAIEYVKNSQDTKQLEWNGREIRNAFQTAVALAVFDAKQQGVDAKPKVTYKHLKQIVKMSTAFKYYMISANQGLGEGDLAFRHGNRDDNFNRASSGPRS